MSSSPLRMTSLSRLIRLIASFIPSVAPSAALATHESTTAEDDDEIDGEEDDNRGIDVRGSREIRAASAEVSLLDAGLMLPDNHCIAMPVKLPGLSHAHVRVVVWQGSKDDEVSAPGDEEEAPSAGTRDIMRAAERVFEEVDREELARRLVQVLYEVRIRDSMAYTIIITIPTTLLTRPPSLSVDQMTKAAAASAPPPKVEEAAAEDDNWSVANASAPPAGAVSNAGATHAEEVLFADGCLECWRQGGECVAYDDKTPSS
jgi:hypothetical protein